MTTLLKMNADNDGKVSRLQVLAQSERGKNMWGDVKSNLKKQFRDLDREHMLELVGLERRRTAAEKYFPIFALFGVGILVGVGVGVMVAPRAGRELRSEIKGKLQQGIPKAKEKANEMMQEFSERVDPQADVIPHS